MNGIIQLITILLVLVIIAAAFDYFKDKKGFSENKEKSEDKPSIRKDVIFQEHSVTKLSQVTNKSLTDQKEIYDDVLSERRENILKTGLSARANENDDILNELLNYIQIINAKKVFVEHSKIYLSIIKEVSELEEFIRNSNENNKETRKWLEENVTMQDKFAKDLNGTFFNDMPWYDWDTVPDLKEEIKNVFNNTIPGKEPDAFHLEQEISNRKYYIDEFMEYCSEIEDEYVEELSRIDAILCEEGNSGIKAADFVFWCNFFNIGSYLDATINSCLALKFRKGFELEKANVIFRSERNYIKCRFPVTDPMCKRLDSLLSNIEVLDRSKEIINLTLNPFEKVIERFFELKTRFEDQQSKDL